MDNKTKLLIAVGASVTSVTTNCQPCLEHVVKNQQENGVKEQEIRGTCGCEYREQRCNGQDGPVRFNSNAKAVVEHSERNACAVDKDCPVETLLGWGGHCKGPECARVNE